MIEKRAWMFGLFCLVGCATTAKKGPEHVKMDPIVVQSGTDSLTGLDGYDATQLLELANQHYANQDYDKSLRLLDHLLDTFSDSDLVPSALFNAGLTLEQLAELEPALARFDQLIADYPDNKSFKDAHFRRVLLLGKLKRWTEVADGFWAIRQLPNLTTMDELEARVGQGVGMFMQGDHATAEREFRRAIRFYDEKSKNEFLPAEYWIGQSRFYLGEIYAREFETKALSAPSANHDTWVAMMGNRLEEKCELLLRAQNNFIRAIRVGHTGWASASGFRIGSLYERLYDDLLKVDLPPDLTEDQAEVYQSELKKRVSVLVSKAIKVYEASLDMAQRVGEQNEWVDKTSASLERMKSLYLAELDG